MPTAPLIPKANRRELPVMIVGIRLKWDTSDGRRKPKISPKIPPENVKSKVSERN